MSKWCELLRLRTEYLFETSNQVRVIWDHLSVSAVCDNLGVVVPGREYRVGRGAAKELRYVVESEERVALGSRGKFDRLDALDRMVNAAVHDKPVHEKE
jgi:hypothetical protein